MEFKDIYLFLKRYIWIIILGGLLGLCIGLVIMVIKPYDYEATSQILISRNGIDKASDYGYLTDVELSTTYANLLKTKPIMDEVAKEINGQVTANKVTVTPILDTMIIQITVQNHSAKKAADIANAFADVMVDQNANLQASQIANEINSLNTQINQVSAQIGTLSSVYDDQTTQLISRVNQQIDSYESEILTLQTDIAAIGTPITPEDRKSIAEKTTRLNEIQPQLTLYQSIQTNLEYIGHPFQTGSGQGDQTLTQIQTNIDQYQKIYQDLVNNLEDAKLIQIRNTPSVIKIEQAAIPKEPSLPTFLFNPVILCLVGIILATLCSIALQYLDIRLLTPQQINDQLGLKILGSVKKLTWQKIKNGEVSEQVADSPAGNSILNIRASLELLRFAHPFKSILVTSFFDGDGKSILAYNLALSYALGKEPVVLVDANFNHPEVDSDFEIENNKGLGDILFGGYSYTEKDVQQVIPNYLDVITTGKQIPSSDWIINPNKMSAFLGSLKERNEIIILDSSSLTDANMRILSGVVDCMVIVMQPGRITAKAAKQILQNLNLKNLKVVGVVINDYPKNSLFSSAIKRSEKKPMSSMIKGIAQFKQKKKSETSDLIQEFRKEIPEGDIKPAQEEGFFSEE